MVLVRLLGPVDLLADGVPRSVQGLRAKAVLAALALHDGEIVSVDRLLEIVWAGDGAAASAKTLQSQVSRLRRVLGEGPTVLARSGGYVLNVGVGDGTDVQAARRLMDDAGAVSDLRERLELLRTALALWRGQSLADLTRLEWFDRQSQQLEHLLLQVRLAIADTRLALGEHLALVPELQDLVQQHDLNEQLQGQLILALYRAGRQGDALATYQRLLHMLNEELGIDPSPPLRELQTAILRQDPALMPPETLLRSGPAPTSRAVPAQLPLAIATFAGRTRQLAHLDSLLAETGDVARAATVAICTISGTAGIGKTTLGVHWAHRVTDRFPDGQLYVNLRGYDPGGLPVDPAVAVHGFLVALGVPAERVPVGLDDQVGLYRSLLAGKRVLVMLDNARDADQVRPLLPGTPGCFAVVTSRNVLASLVATEAAHHLTLEVMSAGEARELIIRRLGTRRSAAERDAVDEIVVRCAGLPLALAIVAASAITHPTFPLATIAAELAKAATLDAFRSDHPSTDIRRVFGWSYRALSPGSARLFRLVGLYTGPDIGVPAAASLGAQPLDETRALLAELARAHLLSEHIPGRYALHDLLRVYAAELAMAYDSDDVRQAAVHRMLDHYLYSAYAASVVVRCQPDRLALPAAQAGVIPVEPVGQDDVLAWFAVEHPVLLAAVEQAVRAGLGTHPWQLAWALRPFLHRLGLHGVQVAIEQRALDACDHGDHLGRATAGYGLAYGLMRSSRLGDADLQFRRSLREYTSLGDSIGQARCRLGLGEVAELQGRTSDSLGHNQSALALYQSVRSKAGEAQALNAVGWSHAQLGDFDEGLACCRRALELLKELDDRATQASTWDSLGYIYRALADYEQAAICYQAALDLFRELGYLYFEAGTLVRFGDMFLASGDPHAAGEAWRQALEIFAELSHPDADDVRARLRESRDATRT